MGVGAQRTDWNLLNRDTCKDCGLRLGSFLDDLRELLFQSVQLCDIGGIFISV